MADSRLTRLRNAWEASRTFEDEVAYLRGQLRSGELTRERVQTAADNGHMSARFVLDDKRQPVDEPSPREPWLPLRELYEYAAFAHVSSLGDFEWRFGGTHLVLEVQSRLGQGRWRVVPLGQGEVTVGTRAELRIYSVNLAEVHGRFMLNDEGATVWEESLTSTGTRFDDVLLERGKVKPVAGVRKVRFGNLSGRFCSSAELYELALEL